MNVTRQYNLPNCNLVLEGIEDADDANADILSGKPPMSVLLNAECHLLKSNQTLSGGSVFLTNLAQAVSSYAQGFLSGLFSGNNSSGDYPHISLMQLPEQHLHRLIVEPKPDSGEAKTEIDLSTVELFDLVDAIDRLYADRSTLPNMTLELRSVSKRYRKPEQPLSERLTPVIIGFSSLAIAAGALFMVPVPEVETAEPEPNPVEQTTEPEAETTEPPITPKPEPKSEPE